MDEKQDNTTPATDTSTSVMEVAKNEALSNMMRRFQATLVREPISEKIKEFHAALAEVAQKSAVLMLTTKRIIISGEPTIADEHTIVDAANRLRQVSDAILKYLDFMTEKTGLPSGGDTNLEMEVKAGVRWAKFLLASFKLLKKIERTAGGLIGMKPSGVSTELGELECLEGEHDWFKPNMTSPMIRSPGTSWHKFLCGVHHTIEDRAVFPHQPRNVIEALLPESLDFIEGWIRDEWLKFSEWFNAAGRDIRDPEFEEADMSALTAQSLGCGLAPTINFERVTDHLFPLRQCVSEKVRPGYTTSGHVPFEELNLAISQTVMDGVRINSLEIPTLRVIIPARILNMTPGEEYPL